jgi:hypothetical protein
MSIKAFWFDDGLVKICKNEHDEVSILSATISKFLANLIPFKTIISLLADAYGMVHLA